MTPGMEDKMENNTNNGSFNEFEDLGAETRRYMAEHMGEFRQNEQPASSPEPGRPDFDSLADELRRFIERDSGGGNTADMPAVEPVPDGAGEETRRFMAAGEPADRPVYKDAEPLPRRSTQYQQQRPGDQAHRRPVQNPSPAGQQPRRDAEARRPAEAQGGAPRRAAQQPSDARYAQQGRQQGGTGGQYARPAQAPQRQGGSPPPQRPPQQRQQEPERPDRRKYIYIAVAALAAVAIIAIALVVLLGGGGGAGYEENFNSAMELYIAGDYRGAISALEKARRAEDTEEAAVLLARCHSALGDTDSAIGVLEAWLLTHSGEQAETLLSQYRSAQEAGEALTIGGQSVDPEADSLAISGTALTHADLEAVASLPNLRILSLTDCAISDISPLSALTGLTSLTLSDNNISSVSALSGMSSLRTLYLSGNSVEDYTPLHSLRSLTTLDISGMEISDVEFEELQEALPGCAIISDEPVVEVREITLGGVTFQSDVTELDLSGRGISDISDLAYCEGLETLDLSGNEIEDLSPLVGLSALTGLDISENNISSLSPLMGLTALERLDASSNSVTSIAALTELSSLRSLSLAGNELGSVSPLLGLSSLEELNLDGTGLDDTGLSSLSALSALRTLNVENNPDISVSAYESLVAALPDCEILASEELFSVWLGDAEFDTDTAIADASGRNVRNLDGIERLTQLERLDLSRNPGIDITGLGQMTGLIELIISDCGLTDVDELGGLGRLVSLDLSDNPDLSDIGAVGLLSSLESLNLSGTAVTDIADLAALPRLTTLNLSDCEIEDFSALAVLQSLEYLDLSDTGISRSELRELSSALPGCTIYT